MLLKDYLHKKITDTNNVENASYIDVYQESGLLEGKYGRNS